MKNLMFGLWCPTSFCWYLNEDWKLSITKITVRKLHIEHKIEEHSKCPHVDFIAVYLVLENLRWHEILCAKNSSSYILYFFSESKLCQFIKLNNFICTIFPFSSFLTRMFCSLMSRCKYPDLWTCYNPKITWHRICVASLSVKTLLGCLACKPSKSPPSQY